jgi:predicted unusual protein kinase regulating ubiquinone biosynthesis (AarF/ABC1/UbiB family)
MSLDTCFIVPEEARTAFIDDNIVGKLPEDSRESAKDKAIRIVNDYVGQDLNALSVLAYATERGRFDEFVEKLEGHYQESLQYVHPEARRIARVPGAVRAEAFFLNCYKSMGIEPQQ